MRLSDANVALLAGAFYGFKTVLVPHNLPPESLSAHLQKANVDALITEVGTLDLSLIARGNKQLSLVIWVAGYGNRHMDWNYVPNNLKGKLEVSVWHKLVEEGKDLGGFEVPSYDPATTTPTVSTVWPSSSESGKFIDFKSEVGIFGQFGTITRLTLTLEFRVRYRSFGLYPASQSTFDARRCGSVN